MESTNYRINLTTTGTSQFPRIYGDLGRIFYWALVS